MLKVSTGTLLLQHVLCIVHLLCRLCRKIDLNEFVEGWSLVIILIWFAELVTYLWFAYKISS